MSNYQSIKVGGLTIMTGNTKLGRVMHINLPPPKTCDCSLPCFTGGCYAMKFYKLRTQCRDAWDSNWQVLMRDRNKYFDTLFNVIRNSRPELFRWHSAGDVVDGDYMRRALSLSAACPSTTFKLTTKKHDIAGMHADEIPANATVLLSMWPGVEIPAFADRFPQAWMRDRRNPDTRIPATAFECPGGCFTCRRCYGMRAGEHVVFDKH